MIRLSTIAITLFTTLVVIISSFSVSAQSSAAQIENEYNRMIAEQHTKLRQTESAIQEARNEIYRLQSDPTHSESNLISEQKWLEVLLRDRESILRTISNLNQQKSLAIQNQKDLENSVRQAAEKAKREKRKADQQKAVAEQAARNAARNAEQAAIDAARNAEQAKQDSIDLAEARERQEDRNRRWNQKYEDGKGEFDNKNGNSLVNGLEWPENNRNNMGTISENVMDMASNVSVQGTQSFGTVKSGDSAPVGNVPRNRPLKSMLPKPTPETKPKPELFDIDKALDIIFNNKDEKNKINL